MYPLIEIKTVPIEIEMKVSHAKLEYSRGTADLEISRGDNGGLSIKSRPIKLNIDTFEARNSVVPTAMRSMEQYAQQGQQAGPQLPLISHRAQPGTAVPLQPQHPVGPLGGEQGPAQPQGLVQHPIQLPRGSKAVQGDQGQGDGGVPALPDDELVPLGGELPVHRPHGVAGAVLPQLVVLPRPPAGGAGAGIVSGSSQSSCSSSASSRASMLSSVSKLAQLMALPVSWVKPSRPVLRIYAWAVRISLGRRRRSSSGQADRSPQGVY